jgi:hypothetical protein
MQHSSVYSRTHPDHALADEACELQNQCSSLQRPSASSAAFTRRFASRGGLAFLMIALLTMIGAAIGMLVVTIRREQRAEQLAGAKGLNGTRPNEERPQ